MNYSTRVDRTNQSALRIQVVRYVKRQAVVLKHIGTAHNEDELRILKGVASKWIADNPPQPQLFPPCASTGSSDILKGFEYRGISHTFTHEFFNRLCEHFQFTTLRSKLLIDLVIIRIFEPASKLRSLALLSRYFGINYSEKVLYQSLRKFPTLKQSVEEKMVAVAKREFGFDFSFVLYDVTTLYFETFKSDDLRKPGFSKDNKSQQPQIVIGLMVTPQGFPVSYEIFSGNTFEGTTFLPSILAFKSLHHIETLTIVADAAMLSVSNIKKLIENGLTYIVGARLGNISSDLLKIIDTNMVRMDASTMKTETEHGTLICSYSKKRYTKDLSDMNKYIKRAEGLVQTPGKMRRAKFVSTIADTVSLNDALIEKTKKLLGVKGYYTNLKDVPETDIIAHYHSLWNVEQSFRIAKSDLASRPIFHRKESSIKAHMLICVMALALSKYIEVKTKRSIRSVLDVCRTVTDALLIHRATNTKNVMRAPMPEEMREIQRLVSH